MSDKNNNGPVHPNPNPVASVQALVVPVHLRRPVASQVAAAVEVAAEVRASPHYAADFAAPCPDAEAIAAALEAAAALSAEERAVAKRHASLSRQRGAAWNAALTGVDVLATIFAARAEIDPEFDERYPKLAAFVRARVGFAKRGSAAARAKRKAAKEAAKEPAAKPTPTAGPAAPPNA